MLKKCKYIPTLETERLVPTGYCKRADFFWREPYGMERWFPPIATIIYGGC